MEHQKLPFKLSLLLLLFGSSSAGGIGLDKSPLSSKIEDRRQSYAERIAEFLRQGDSFASMEGAYKKLSASNECAISKDEANLAFASIQFYKKGRESDLSTDSIRRLDFAPSTKAALAGDACSGAFDEERKTIDGHLEKIETLLQDFENSFRESAVLASGLLDDLSSNNGHWRPVCAALRNRAKLPPQGYVNAYASISKNLEVEKTFLEQASLQLAAAKTSAHCGSLSGPGKKKTK